MILHIDCASNIGKTRDENQDVILIQDMILIDDQLEFGVEVNDLTTFTVAVADGMGGFEGGAMASRMAAEGFRDFINSLSDGSEREENTSPTDLPGVDHQVRLWVRKMNAAILEKGKLIPQFAKMGTTLVALLWHAGKIWMLNIGDSRLYRFRNGILKQISRDHSLREITGNANIPSNIIVNALGVNHSISVDIEEITNHFLTGDLFVLCSDGIYDMIDDTTIEQLLSTNTTSLQFTQQANKNGGKDNISIIQINVTK